MKTKILQYEAIHYDEPKLFESTVPVSLSFSQYDFYEAVSNITCVYRCFLTIRDFFHTKSYPILLFYDYVVKHN